MQLPLTYNLPHQDWRTNQYEALQWCQSQNGCVLLEAPTGSGKTALAAALAYDKSVVSLVKTKNLQRENYGETYSFDVLYGRANYPCIHPHGISLSASECLHNEQGMRKCPYASSCPYLIQKAICQGSSMISLNYSYWMSAHWPRGNPPQILVCDEADELPEVVLDFASCTITQKQLVEWGLPPLPIITGHESLLNPIDPVFEAIDWLEESRDILLDAWKKLKDTKGNRDIQKLRQCEQLGMKIRSTLDAIQTNSMDWYIRSGPVARVLGRGKVAPGFVARPLTARFHWNKYFSVSETVLMMSATIGKPEPLARELGIDEFSFNLVPSQWPAEMRPIIIPESTPRLGRKAPDSAYELQADLAAELIHDRPSDWFGIVLVTSKYEARQVTERLYSRGLEDRVWILPEKQGGQWLGTEKQTKLWSMRKSQVPGSILVSWNHWRGYDGLDEKICLCMKTPYPPMGTPGSYENERMRYDGKLYHWRTANLLAQGTGRTRRGREEDYGPDNGLVAVLDGNWSRVKKYLPDSFLEAVVH